MNDFLLEKFNLHETSWKVAYPLFSKVINQYKLNKGVEIGVAFGGHSEAILKQTNIEKLYSVDRYEHDPNYEDPLNYDQDVFDELYLSVKKRLEIFGDRCELVRLDSIQAANSLPDQLDFVYIDADHSYNGVARDLKLWTKKIREGGIIGGHDYRHVNFPGVKFAIDEFFSRFNWKIHEEGEGVWWVEKKPLNVTYIIPAFNCATTIGDTINSIYTDNFLSGDELIIVNDHSTDNTSDVIREFSEKNSSITIYEHKENKGTAAAGRNTGIENAKNEIIFCLDADNILQPKSIQKLKECLINQCAEIAAFGELWFFSESINKITHKWVFQKEITLSDALAGFYWPGPSGNYLFTRSSWIKAGRYFEPFLDNQTMDSWIFGIRQLGTGQRMVTLPESGYFHRYGHESHFVRNSKKGYASLTALIGIIPFLDQIKKNDIEYLFGKTNRLNWYENIHEKPIRVKESLPGHDGYLIEMTQTNNETYAINSVIYRIRNYLTRLFKK